MNNLTFDIDTIENTFAVKLKRNCVVIGLDTASKSGVCIAKTDKKNVSLSISFINVDVSKIKDKQQKNELRYSVILEKLQEIITNQEVVVIEDVFYSRNPRTLILLARIGAIAYTLAKVKKIKTITWLTAVQARKALGLPCNKKKVVVQTAFCEKLGLENVMNEDEIDAIILALNGLIE